MSEQSNIAPGWYPDPAGSGGDRWWDGIGWTENLRAAPVAPPAPPIAPPVQAGVQAPAPGAPVQQAPAYADYGQAGKRPELPASTDTNTPWIWVLVFLPILGILPLFLFNWVGYLETTMSNPLAPGMAMLDPGYIVLTLVGWVAYAANIVLAYLDSKQLKARGVVRPFHWAWTFLNSLVYIIGRSVIVGKVAQGRGKAPMWVAIAVNVVLFVVAIVWCVWLITVSIEMAMMYASYGY